MKTMNPSIALLTGLTLFAAAAAEAGPYWMEPGTAEDLAAPAPAKYACEASVIENRKVVGKAKVEGHEGNTKVRSGVIDAFQFDATQVAPDLLVLSIFERKRLPNGFLGGLAADTTTFVPSKDKKAKLSLRSEQTVYLLECDVAD